MERIVRTACQACHCECGVLVHVRDGKVVKVEGDPVRDIKATLTTEASDPVLVQVGKRKFARLSVKRA